MDVTCSLCDSQEDYHNHDCLAELKKEYADVFTAKIGEIKTEGVLMSLRYRVKEYESKVAALLAVRKRATEQTARRLEAVVQHNKQVETRRDTIRTALIDAMGDN